MALGATMFVFDVELADADRGVYQKLALRVARHPSESDDHLVARVLAWCLEYTEGIAYSRGLSEPDEPAIAIRDLTGQLTTWIDIGAPDAARLHRAAKSAARVVVYTHKDAAQLATRLRGAKIHRLELLELYAFDREFVAAVVARLQRRMAFSLTVSERQLYLTVDGSDLTSAIERISLV
jgi:uncharacterized protein YaeQ